MKNYCCMFLINESVQTLKMEIKCKQHIYLHDILRFIGKVQIVHFWKEISYEYYKTKIN